MSCLLKNLLLALDFPLRRPKSLSQVHLYSMSLLDPFLNYESPLQDFEFYSIVFNFKIARVYQKSVCRMYDNIKNMRN